MTKESSGPISFSREFVERLKKGAVSTQEACEIAQEAAEIFAGEPSLLELPGEEAVVFGDVHGQFYDLLNVFEQMNAEGEKDQILQQPTYLFLGDYVDRGSNSLETVLLLLHLKIRHRNRIWILRGNHESRRLSYSYGFHEECMRSMHSPCAWAVICRTFDVLPLAAVVGGHTFAVHGGIGPSVTLQAIREIDRVSDVPTAGIVADMLWSDPGAVAEFEENTRGAGWVFGEIQVGEFLKRAGCRRIIRSHQLVDQGYREDFNGQVLTIWSAPNYCYRCGNRAVFARVSEKTVEYTEIPAVQEQRGPNLPLPYFI